MALLTNDWFAIPADGWNRISITTQVSIDVGRPDIEIATPDRLVYVEVKVESPVDPDQLKRYRHSLEQDKRTVNKQLVLLTRYQPAPIPAEVYHATRWIRVAHCLDDAAARHLRDEPVGTFLVEQFTSFLVSRNIAMRQVGGHISDGLQAMRSLLLMVEEALRACGLEPKQNKAWEYIGYTCAHAEQTNKYWVGISFSEPSFLIFETNEMPLDKNAPARLGIGGEVEEKWWEPGSYRWSIHFDLSTANEAFYQASASDQFRQIESFVKDSLEKVRRIEAAQQL